MYLHSRPLQHRQQHLRSIQYVLLSLFVYVASMACMLIRPALRKTPPPFQTPHNQARSLQMEASLPPAHMAHTTHTRLDNHIAISRQPCTLEPCRRRPLPLLPTAARIRLRRPNPIWQRRARLRLCRLLYHSAIIHARIHHAAHDPALRNLVRHQVPRKAGALHGASVHGIILQHLRAIRAVGYVADARVVLQHKRHV